MMAVANLSNAGQVFRAQNCLMTALANLGKIKCSLVSQTFLFVIFVNWKGVGGCEESLGRLWIYYDRIRPIPGDQIMTNLLFQVSSNKQR